MKRITAILILLCLCLAAKAVPALPGKFKKTLPDGSSITLELHGDEYYHWHTDASGNVVELGSDGFFHRVSPSLHKGRLSRANTNRPRGRWSSYDQPFPTNFGDRKVLCIIANFTDSTFVIDNPREQFHNLLNQEGYSGNGSIGSVRDYFIDNSEGQFRPQFDVFGPVNLTHSSKYYDDNGAQLAILEAYAMMADQINIDDYDTDDDGDIDMVLFYYPGRNEAELAGPESIWPHQKTGSFGMMGTKLFNRYFCTSELRYAEGPEMCNIGITCHEFSHSLGLPDFYDTNYDTYGINDDWSKYYDLMGGGNYNDLGRRPPYLSATERNMLGWRAFPEAISSGNYSLSPVRDGDALFCPTKVEGEYFVMEYRDDYKWDSGFVTLGLEPGLIIYHVDKSSRVVGMGYSAANLWDQTNSINAFGGHPCYWPVSSYDDSDDVTYTFPGPYGIDTYSFVDWDGNSAETTITDIRIEGGKCCFTAKIETERLIIGHIYDVNGTPIGGATVTLTQSEHAFAPARVGLSRDVVTTTDADGYYEFTLPESASSDQIVTASKDGYVPVAENLSVDAHIKVLNFTLPRIDEGEHCSLQRYDPSKYLYTGPILGSSVGYGIKYYADELEQMGAVGSRIGSISFAAFDGSRVDSYGNVYVIVDFIVNGVYTRAIKKDVTDIFLEGPILTKVSLSDDNITIPSGADVLICYAISDIKASHQYPFYLSGLYDEWVDGTYILTDIDDPSSWDYVTFNGAYLSNLIGADIAAPRDAEYSDFGIATITLDGAIAKAVPPADKTVFKTEWFVDGTSVDSAPDTSALSPGDSHVIMALLTYYDGTTDRLYLDL